jgi:hypothetical protein
VRLLHIPIDPRTPDPTNDDPRDSTSGDAWRAYLSAWTIELQYGALAEFVELLVARGLAPRDWLETERLTALVRLGPAVLPILRNPRALIDAEAILREGLTGTGGQYVGLRSWVQLCSTGYAPETGRYVPSTNVHGRRAMRVELSRNWLEATRDTGSSYGSKGHANAWCCADQILGGPAWITDLYRTGLGLWCLRDVFDNPEWVLIVRPGDGLPWPERDGETQNAPTEAGAEVTT